MARLVIAFLLLFQLLVVPVEVIKDYDISILQSFHATESLLLGLKNQIIYTYYSKYYVFRRWIFFSESFQNKSLKQTCLEQMNFLPRHNHV